MKKILLAVGSQLLTKQLSNLLSACDVQSSATGMDVPDRVLVEKPDVLVVDLMLCGLEGLHIIQKVRTCHKQCRIVVLVSFVADYVLDKLEELGVSYVCRMPCCCNNLAMQILDLTNTDQVCRSVEEKIRNLMWQLGFSESTNGYLITRKAIEAYMQCSDVPLYAGLYPQVAHMCDTTDQWVERAIRRSVESAHHNCAGHIWAEYFGFDKNGRPKHPSNKVFLHKMAAVIEDWCVKSNYVCRKIV